MTSANSDKPLENSDINDNNDTNSNTSEISSDEQPLYESFVDHLETATTETEQQSASTQREQTALLEQFKIEQAKVSALQEELDRTKDQMMRALAETENMRGRARREKEDASKFAISAFSKDLLSVADNLRRALEALPEDIRQAQPEIKNLADGIEATERELLRSFEKNGIKKLLPIDLPFDPHFHEVMFEAPVPGKTAGTIIQIIEPGYTLNERILRPARVGIAKDTGDNSPAPPPEGGHHIDTEA